jgi:hypothetical protein
MLNRFLIFFFFFVEYMQSQDISSVWIAYTLQIGMWTRSSFILDSAKYPSSAPLPAISGYADMRVQYVFIENFREIFLKKKIPRNFPEKRISGTHGKDESRKYVKSREIDRSIVEWV